MARYGTLLDSVEGNLAQVKEGQASFKRVLILGLVSMAVFCIATFTLVLGAIAHQKDMVVANGVLVDAASMNPIRVRQHEANINNPLTDATAAAVQYVTISKPDGSASRESIVGYYKYPCSESNGCYVFKTASGEQLQGQVGENGIEFARIQGGAARRSLLSDTCSGDSCSKVTGVATGAPLL